jgi:hypothetical protein
MERQPAASRAMIGRPPGLDWVQTCVLKATCDVAMELWERRLTLDQVVERLAIVTSISRAQIVASLGPLCERGYLIADDAPGNPEIVVHLTRQGLAEYCARFVTGYGQIEVDILKLVCRDSGADVVELAHRSRQAELLVEHVLETAEGHGLLRLTRTGQYVVVRDVMPQLRRWVSGAA